MCFPLALRAADIIVIVIYCFSTSTYTSGHNIFGGEGTTKFNLLRYLREIPGEPPNIIFNDAIITNYIEAHISYYLRGPPREPPNATLVEGCTRST